MKFSLANFFELKVRQGGCTYKKEKMATESDLQNEFWVEYTHDVYTYIYVVPKIFKSEIGDELLSFFYKDNEDYTDEQLVNFKEEHAEFFK